MGAEKRMAAGACQAPGATGAIPLFLEEGVGRSLRRALLVARRLEASDLRKQEHDTLVELGDGNLVELLSDFMLRLLPGLFVRIFRHFMRLKDIRASRRREG